jgi:type IV pilus assembly protein PilC
MGSYVFQAKTPEGKIVKGELEASSENEAKVMLRAQKLIPMQIVPKGAAKLKVKKGFSFGGGIAPQELQVFTRQFAVLIAAGVPVVQSIEAMIGPGRSPNLNKCLQSILSEVGKGRRLAVCMAEHPDIFDNMYVNLVHAGEEGGVLDTILNRLAAYIEKSVKLKGKIKGALFYPAAVIVVAAIVVSAIMIFVLPNFVKMFKDSGMELPWLTLQVMNASDFMVSYWYLLLAILIAIPMGIGQYYKTEEGRQTLDKIIIKLPLFGDLVRKGAIARFSRTLSTMLSAGVRIIDALDIAIATTKSYPIEVVLMQAKDAISKGRSLSEPLKASPLIPHMVTQMISVGEQTGGMDQMLDKVANFFEDEVETAAGALTSMIEPMLMVGLGSIIAVLVIAMYLPIFNMAGALSGGK